MKNDKTPVLLKFVRWIFPKLEVVAPSLAQRYFIKIFFTPLRYKMPAKEIPFDIRAKKFSVQISTGNIQGYSWGEGPVVLLVHGWAGRATQFRKFIEVLTEKGYQVVGFDGPAHGRSDGKKTSIHQFHEALVKIYQKVGEPVAILAHSFGGSAVLYAAMSGLSVKKLVNIASPTIGDEIINTYLRAINGSKKTGDFFKAYVKKQEGKNFDEYTSLHFIQHLKQEIRLLLVHDEDDQEVILEQALELKKVYPIAELLITKGLGHTRILRDEAVIQKVVTFIES